MIIDRWWFGRVKRIDKGEKVEEIRLERNRRRGGSTKKWTEIIKEDMRTCGVVEGTVEENNTGSWSYLWEVKARMMKMASIEYCFKTVFKRLFWKRLFSCNCLASYFSLPFRRSCFVNRFPQSGRSIDSRSSTNGTCVRFHLRRRRLRRAKV